MNLNKMKMVVGFMVVLLMAISAGAAEAGAASGETKMRLRVKVLRAYPQPVIDAKTPGTEEIPGGFECGNTVKVMIDGQPEYHFFALRMPSLDWVDYGSDHWVSKDGFSWSEDGLNWPMTQGQIVNINEGLAPDETGWWKGAWAVRTPHQLIDEGDGTYTVFFTGASTLDYFKGFRAVGRLKVQLIEEPISDAAANAQQAPQTQSVYK